MGKNILESIMRITIDVVSPFCICVLNIMSFMISSLPACVNFNAMDKFRREKKVDSRVKTF